jgi:sulfane dehydrogenase subunit SoxC
VHHSDIPDIDPQRHSLMLHGLVEQPLKFDWERLQRYPMVNRVHFLECAGNSAANALSPFAMDVALGQLAGEVSNAEWTGIPLSFLIDEARPKASAKWVIAEGADGGSHARSLPLQALREHGMLALYQNGERLRPSQGYPMRLFVPGWEGNANVKWLHRLEFSDTPAYTKDESGLYTQVLADGRIQRFAMTMEVKSLITRPSGQQTLPDPQGYFEIEGFAWSGRGAIARVDVSVDGGQHWVQAQLHGPVLERAFARFTLPWAWRGQKAVLMSRATDTLGHVQPTRSVWKARYAAHSFNHYNAIQAWAVGRDGKVKNTYA